MRGRRQSVRKFGAALALVAMALQFVLTFGHVHPEDFFRASGALHLAQAQGAPAPNQPAPGLPSHDDCPLCASIAMLGTSALPAPVALAPPPEQGNAATPALPAPALFSSPRLPFQTRAPPLA